MSHAVVRTRRLCSLLDITVNTAARDVDCIRPANCALATIKLRLYCQVVAVVSSSIDLTALGRVGTALADPTRRRILVELLDGPAYPTELADTFGTTRANLSNHLTCLRECGLVTATAEGRRVRYELADTRLLEALQILAGLDLPGACDR